MSYFRVKIWMEGGQVKSGIREYASKDLDEATQYLARVAVHQLGMIRDIEVAMLSPYSKAVRDFQLLNTRNSHTIPVMFKYEGRELAGTLCEVFGAGEPPGCLFHLNVQSMYWGRLRFANDKWVFDPTPKTESLIRFTEYFARAVEAVVNGK